jgi:cob(I)alamin adenosyltransferase
MVIYTRKGDRGVTSLSNGQRVPKTDLRVEICGTVDELNSMLGVALSMKYSVLSIKRELLEIQKDLLGIGSIIANPDPQYSIQNTKYFPKRAKEFENFIDEMTAQMPVLKKFILPGGGEAGSILHLSRAISRRLERRIVALDKKEKIDKNILIYLNRLSDLLFTMARFANFKEKKKEIIWPACASAFVKTTVDKKTLAGERKNG